MGHRRWAPALRLALLATILLAFALRVFALDRQSLWYDEGVTAAIAQRGLGELTRWTANDIQPPLYYLLAAGWGRVAGWNEYALRFPSVYFGVLLVSLLAALAQLLTRYGPQSGRKRSRYPSEADSTAGLTLTGAESVPVNGAALLAALLAALHPLLVYYSQEARMYTLLVALATLIGWLLVKAANLPRPGWPLWLGYVVASGAAVYTHYFAFFLLVGLGAAYLIDVIWQSRRTAEGSDRRAHVGGFVLANLLVLVFYAPWLTVLFTRLRVDRSYWTGALKLQEALLDIGISFTSGATVTERASAWLLVGYGVVTLLAVWWLWRSGATGRRLLLYAGFWLVAPIIAVLALAYNVPKFNARYVMLALPGLLLIWAAGLHRGLVRDRGQLEPGPQDLSSPSSPVTPHPSPVRPAPTRIRRGLAAGGVLLLLTGFLYANYNWFFNGAFGKDEWRDLAAFLRPRLAADELVVLVSGHAWPVWEYYASDLPTVRLPELEILDVDAVLDFANTGPALKAAFAEETGKHGAWLVSWQDEVVDPNGVVATQLELGGREKGQSFPFYGLTLQRFSGQRAKRFENSPPIEQPVDISFGGAITLRGYKVVDNGDLLLFWASPPGAAAPADDLHFALESFTGDGKPLAHPPDRRLAGYNYPTARWPAGAVVAGRVPAAAWLGDNPQPGSYRFSLRVYGASTPGAPLQTPDGRTQVDVGPVDVEID